MSPYFIAVPDAAAGNPHREKVLSTLKQTVDYEYG